MREMKDSGIDWIGEIPNYWNKTRIGYKSWIRARLGWKGLTADEYVESGYPFLSAFNIQNDKLDWSDLNYINQFRFDESPEIKLKKGDIIFVKAGAGIGKCARIDELPFGESTTNGSLAVISTRDNLDYKFLYYCMLSSTFQKYITRLITGMGVPSLAQEKIKKICIPIPPINEQLVIIDYLDSKCSEIDAITKDIQKQIEVLEDYKKSVITEAVTKGLEPDVEMKDSTMKWIGDVPTHWKVDKLKFHLYREEFKNPGDKQVLSVYREYGVIPKDSRDDNHNVTSEDVSKYKYVKPGWLVINKMKAWQGSMGVSEYEGIVSPAYFIYKFKDKCINPKYIHFLFRNCYKDEFRRISGGIREGQWDLNPFEFENELILIPTLEEQNRIVEYIESFVSEIEHLVSNKQKQLEILADYKKSLIYEYVTGKKEVNV
ncbi:MAG: restriction endonuclease subunit S [Acholeplasmatales bacterium]|nr:restriction endonuclease subunit S [Acholeplasmatales bacterium]